MKRLELLTPEQRRRIARADRERGCLIALVVVIVLLLFWLLWAFNHASDSWNHGGHGGTRSDDGQLMEIRGRAHAEVQGPRSKVQGPRSKVQGLNAGGGL